MPSSDGHPEYDANLLSTAPAPTKGMVQSGYATDLLQDKPNPSKPDDLEAGRHTSLLRPNRAKPVADGTEPKEPSTAIIRTKLSPSTEKRPFYRTTKGIVILIIVAVVILAAIIGGAVGGALSRQRKIDPLPVSTTPPTPGSGDAGPQSVVPGDNVSSSSQGGGQVTNTIRVTTTLDPTAAPRIPVSSTELGGFSLTFTR